MLAQSNAFVKYVHIYPDGATIIYAESIVVFFSFCS